MTGIDIINALNDIDEQFLSDAATPARHIPRWLRFSSLAACVVCVLLAGYLSCNRLLVSPQAPGALTVGAAPEESTITLSSSLYPVSLTVPVEYSDHILVDTPFSDDIEAFNFSIQLDNVAFSFHQDMSEPITARGLVWVISVLPVEEFDYDYYEANKFTTMFFNKTVLGQDDTYVYQITYRTLNPEFISFDDPETAQSYLQYHQTGYALLEQFITENALEEDPDWKTIFTSCTITPLTRYLDALEP